MAGGVLYWLAGARNFARTADLGTSGQVLTSNGASAAPTFQAAAAGYTDEQAQDAVGTILVDGTTIDFTYNDGTPSITAERAALTGDVTASAGSNATTIANDAVTNAKAANMAGWTFKARNDSGPGDPQDVAVADLTEDETPELEDYAIGFLSSGEIRKFRLTRLVSLAGGHAHGLMRVLGDGSTTTFNLLDIAEYLEHIAVNGSVQDPATVTLSADGSQVTFDAAPTAGQVIALAYVIAGL